MKLIAETAWHHEGDFDFMWRLINALIDQSQADIIKMHITLDFDEYMHQSHELYSLLKTYTFNEQQWTKLITQIKQSDKQLMLLLNDTKAIEFAQQFNPELVELHSVAINNPFLLNKLKHHIDDNTQTVFGIGGCEVAEVDYAMSYFAHNVLMFGFQNFPTQYRNINLAKMRKLMRLFQACRFGYADHCAWDESNNELITLLCAANGMDYLEKHVTTQYGEQRTDYAAAISIKMLNQLADKIKLLAQIEGSGRLDLNAGEKLYATYGPMKMAALAKRNLAAGDILQLDDIKFQRTQQISDLSQKDVLAQIGKKTSQAIRSDELLMRHHFQNE